MSLRTLILGGYGTFGRRLAKLLAQEQGVELLIAGRSLDKAAAFCAGLRATSQSTPVALDRNGDVRAALESLRPDLIVDASGPFQSYGEDPYRVVKAALALGIDYLDFADGADFVGGIGQFDRAARDRGVFILPGASSFPLLTAAAVRRLARGMMRIDAIAGGIAPSPNPEAIGPNVIGAIAGYAGKPVTILRDGRPITAHGLTETRRCNIAPPGCVPLGRRGFSLVQVPDLHVLPALWPEVKTVWLGAAPAPAMLHRALIGLAWLVRFRLIPSLSPFAGMLFGAYKRLAWGDRRGGMFVSVAGMNSASQALERSWHLLAEGDDGPFIPAMGAAAIIRRCLAGRRPAAGARSAAAELELDDYAPMFAGRAICAGVRETTAEGDRLTLYRRLLGESWAQLPAPLRALHDLEDRFVAEGRATVDRGTGLLARLVAAIVGFPGAGRDVPVTVQLERRGQKEFWRRTFAGRSFASTLSAGSKRWEHLMVERFGPFALGFALVPAENRLKLVARGWSFLGLPLPLWLAPGGESYEFAADGRFNFHVEIGHPLIGLIVRYQGWLVPR